MEQAQVHPWLEDIPELTTSGDVINRDVDGYFADLAKSSRSLCPVEP